MTVPPTLATSSVVLCDQTCVDGHACGGVFATALSVYLTGAGPLNFSLLLQHV